VNKKEQILKAALKLLTEKGVHATPVSAIAKEAGTGMGTIYNYFPTKEDLINALYVSIKHEEQEALVKVQADLPIKTQFEAYYSSAVQFFIDSPVFFEFMQQLQFSPIITEESKAAGYAAIEVVFELIELGKQQRIIKDLPTIELMQFVGGTVSAYLRYHFDHEQVEASSLHNQLKLVWDAIKE